MKNEVFIDKLAWIHIEDGRILMALSKNKDTYYIPGGKREEGENDIRALKREIQEELTINLKEGSIIKYGFFEGQAHGEPEGRIVRMSCYLGDYEGEIIPSREIQDLAYYSYVQRDLVGPVDQIIFDDLHKKGLLK